MSEDTLEDVVELFDSNQIEDEEIKPLDEVTRLLSATVFGAEVEVVEFPKEHGLNDNRFEVIVYDFEAGAQSDTVNTAQEVYDTIGKYS